MTAPPWSYELRLHRLLHRVIASSSTGSPQLVHRLVHRLYGSLRESATAKQPGLISARRLDRERQRSVDSGVGSSKTPVTYDECKAKIKTLARQFDYNSSAVNVNL